jgi:hypothetical protein
MATFDQIALALQLVQNLQGLKRDMRANATGYKRQLAAGKVTADVGDVAARDASEYLRRLDWHGAVMAKDKDAALVALGIDPTEESALVDSLRIIATGQQDALSVKDAGAISAAADAVLAATPDPLTLWPQ